MRSPIFTVCRGLPLLMLTLATSVAQAETAWCHTTYGGQTKTIAVEPGGDPYRAPTLKIGTFFRFRVVIETEREEMASVKTYVYADREGAPAILQQATYPWPVIEGQGQRHGFTGLQRIYEAALGSEFEYWCSVTDSGKGES
jgi:hypothetical protein